MTNSATEQQDAGNVGCALSGGRPDTKATALALHPNALVQVRVYGSNEWRDCIVYRRSTYQSRGTVEGINDFWDYYFDPLPGRIEEWGGYLPSQGGAAPRQAFRARPQENVVSK